MLRTVLLQSSSSFGVRRNLTRDRFQGVQIPRTVVLSLTGLEANLLALEPMTMYNSHTTPPPPPLLAAPKIFLCCRILSVTLLLLFPFYFFYAPAKGNNAVTYGMAFWDAMLHISVVPLIFLTVIIGLLFVVDDRHSSSSIEYLYKLDLSIKDRSMNSHRVIASLLP
jgi:hypothetical protein